MDQIKKKIAMIVYNSVSHDARVLKEAESLVKNGYRVRIFGIQDNRNSIEFEITDEGIEIERTNWKSVQYDFYARITAFVMFLLLAILAYMAFADAAPVFTFSDLKFHIMGAVPNFFTVSVPHFFTAFFVEIVKQTNLIQIIVIFGMFFTLYVGARKYRRFQRIASNYRRNGGEQQSASKTFAIKKLIASLQYIFKRMMVSGAMQKAVYSRLRAFEPEVIHCHDLPTLPGGDSYRTKHNCKLVYDSHEIYEEMGAYGSVTKIFFTFIQRKYTKHVDKFITINESIAYYLGNKYPALPDAVIVKNATKRLSSPVQYDGRLHEAAGLAEDVPVLLYQGGFGQRRGLEILVKSAPLLPSDWVLVMMGWGSLENRLKAIAQKVDPEATKVRFIPSVPQKDLPYWTAGGTVGIIPYENVNLNHWYCTPNKLWEYPNAGVPLLVSPFPEMEKIVEKYKVGWLLDEKLSESNIARSIKNINDVELKNAADACRKFSQCDNWDIYESRLVEMYSSM